MNQNLGDVNTTEDEEQTALKSQEYLRDYYIDFFKRYAKYKIVEEKSVKGAIIYNRQMERIYTLQHYDL